MSPLTEEAVFRMDQNLRIIDKAIIQKLSEQGIVNDSGNGWSYPYCKAVIGYYSDKQLRQAWVLLRYDSTFTSEWKRAIHQEFADRQIAKLLLQD